MKHLSIGILLLIAGATLASAKPGPTSHIEALHIDVPWYFLLAGSQGQNFPGVSTTNNNTFTGINTVSNLNGHIAVDGLKYTSIQAALNACPAGPAACFIDVSTNQTVTAGITYTGVLVTPQPVTLTCIGSDPNGNGNTLTFSPPSAPATMFLIKNIDSRFIIRGCSLQQGFVSITTIVGNGATATVTLPGNVPSWIVTNGYVYIYANANSGFDGIQKVTGTGSGNFTFASAVNATQTGGQVGLAGPITTLTQVAGNGTTATGTCSAACGFVAGTYPAVVFGNSQAFNGVWEITSTGVGATTFTFPSPVNATNAGGSAYVGINGFVAAGMAGSASMQGGGLQDSSIGGFSGVGYKLDAGQGANASYNYSSNSHIWFNGVNISLNGSAFANGVVNQNMFAQVTTSNAAYFNLSLKGNASENNFNTGEISGWTTPLADLGDGTSVCRDIILWNMTMEAGAASPTATNQHGADNACNLTMVHTEGALQGPGTPITINDVSGGTHWLFQGSSTGPGGLHTESTVPPLIWDKYGNVAASGGTLTGVAAAPNGIAIGANDYLCGANFNSCNLQLTASGILVVGTKTFNSPLYATATNCAVNSVSPAACGSAAAGVFAIPAAQTTYTVNTSAVTASSRIFLQSTTDNTGIPSAPTCVDPALTAATSPSARVAATSFTIQLTSNAGITCYAYWIVN